MALLWLLSLSMLPPPAKILPLPPSLRRLSEPGAGSASDAANYPEFKQGGVGQQNAGPPCLLMETELLGNYEYMTRAMVNHEMGH